ncbi:MAG: winged helix-turn-helix domain-containing protein [Calothrix sp. MO_167.B12]|nr:winged helix-turn-helix domain-containing protein [Calothrix sp. MO_167.B12]
MTIPDYQSIMLPLLKYAANGKEHSFRETIESLSHKFNLSESEKKNCYQVDNKLYLIIASDGQKHI